MRVSKTISAPTQNVWQVLVDTKQWPTWGPSVKAVSCPQQYISAGLKGKIQTIFGIWINFEITRFEPLKYWEWKVAGIPATGHKLKEIDNNNCEIIFELPFITFPYALICLRAIDRIAHLAKDVDTTSDRSD